MIEVSCALSVIAVALMPPVPERSMYACVWTRIEFVALTPAPLAPMPTSPPAIATDAAMTRAPMVSDDVAVRLSVPVVVETLESWM